MIRHRNSAYAGEFQKEAIRQTDCKASAIAEQLGISV